ncbi:MAG: class I SAM-dependent methyltransferase [Candidatus Omnitrophota bacterium]
MEKDKIPEAKRAIAGECGPWTAHNIRLGEGLYTIDDKLNYDTVKLRRVMQVLSDLSCGEFGALKILDLGSFEGLYTIEAGLRGVTYAMGVEARSANLKKAEFVKGALDIKNINFVRDDVRNISVKKYGKFDVVLCLGLLYHIDLPDIFGLLENIYDLSTRFLVIDTHIALNPDTRVEHRGRSYFGTYASEFRKGLSKEAKEKLLWNALDNERSFIFSKASLIRVIGDLGFTSVYECLAPLEHAKPKDRVTLVAIRGKRAGLLTYPAINGMDEESVKAAVLRKELPKFAREGAAIAALKAFARALVTFLKTITGRYYRER